MDIKYIFVDILFQNNQAMKKQVEALSKWQEEVHRVQESHKQKFAEMKEYIAIVRHSRLILFNILFVAFLHFILFVVNKFSS